MKIIDFFKSLLPNFAKQTVLEDIRTTKLIMTTVTMPAYQEGMRVFGGRKFSNESLQKDWEVYRRNVKGASGANTIVAVEKSFKDVLSTLDLLETLVEKDYNEDIEGSGVTYYKAAVLQMIESVSFAVDFATKYLNYVYVVESASLFDDNGVHRDENGGITVVDEINASIVPAEVRFLHDRFIDFCTVMDTLSKPTTKIKENFEEIPDITITPSGDRAIQSTMGTARLDPFRHGFVPLAMNPIYHIRMQVADWQHYRYERAKSDKEMLQLRKLKLERDLAGKPDAAIERQIEYTQKRIDDLSTQIRKVEEQYA
jgi:hypothetical protein